MQLNMEFQNLGSARYKICLVNVKQEIEEKRAETCKGRMDGFGRTLAVLKCETIVIFMSEV
jgi:hypothetical protein